MFPQPRGRAASKPGSRRKGETEAKGQTKSELAALGGLGGLTCFTVATIRAINMMLAVSGG